MLIPTTIARPNVWKNSIPGYAKSDSDSLIHLANMVPLSSTRNAVPEVGLDSAPAGSNRVDRTTTAVNSAATARDETTMIHEEFDGDSRVVLVGTRAASRTEGSLEELVIGQTCYRGPFTPPGWQMWLQIFPNLPDGAESIGSCSSLEEP